MFYQPNYTLIVVNTKSEPEKDEKIQTNYFQTAGRVLTLIKSKWIHFFVATISAVVIGAAPVIVAMLHVEFYGVSTVKSFLQKFTNINQQFTGLWLTRSQRSHSNN